MSFLAVDIGNTRLKWALYADDARPGASPERQGAVFIENIDRLADDDWQHLPPCAPCSAAMWAAMRCVGVSKNKWTTLGRGATLVVPSTQAGGVTNGYDHPTRLGADRWVAVIGARAHAGSGALAGRCWW